MNPLVPFLWVAGGVHLAIAATNVSLPRRLRYRENLSRVWPIIRQVFVVHSIYAVFVVFFSPCCVFSSRRCLLATADLAGSSVRRWRFSG